MLRRHHHTGIYLTRTHSNWAITTTQRNGSVIENHAYHHDLSNSQSLSCFVNELQKQHPSHYHKPQVILASDWYLLKHISLDQHVKKNEFTRYLQQQAIHEFNVAYDDLLIDYQRLPTHTKQDHCAYVIAACQKSSLNPILNIISPQHPPRLILIDALGINTSYINHKLCHLILIGASDAACHSTIIHKKRIIDHQPFDFSQNQHHGIDHIWNAIHDSIEKNIKKRPAMIVLLGTQTDFLINLKKHLITSWPNITTECLFDKIDPWCLSPSHPYHHGMATLAALKGQWHAN